MVDPFANVLRVNRNQPRPEEKPAPAETLPATKPKTHLARREKNELIEEIQLYRDLTPAQIDKLNVWMERQNLGMSIGSGPLVCREGCAHKEVCPLHAENIHPLGKPCPVEASLMMHWKRKWAASLGMDIDDQNMNDAFDLKLLDDLSMISLLKRRALNEMATESPEIAEKIIAGYVDDQPMEKVILNPRVQLIERFGKLEIKIYNELLSTRKAKFQVAGRIDDLSRRQAELKKKMDLVRNREELKIETEVVDAEFEVRDA